ncbi:uncharacterized protein LOC100574615 [Acyrthosiphon pisum]|uniref:Uncharacterized protein n=1 Tax=Acyrthosiphon pisum TaxID=7029 RepID=A0A8R2A4I9_ACYPI|nr:uncharacterized protein LOC100574615 [Acyrthosiphon pisum]|eukprot:XP_003242206.1 PREDICTED: uncharacterized protein LOC100574615 [Acyrthosiphon pisum]
MSSVTDTAKIVRAEVEDPKQSTSERPGDILIGGCQYSKTDKLKPELFSKNLPRTKLAGVKSNLYNPVQSTFRRRDIENVQGKLSDELSGNTLPPGLVALPNYNDHKFDPPQIVFPGYDILPMPLNAEYQNKTIDELSFLRHKDMSDLWKKFIDNVPMSKTRIAHIPKNKDFRFHNYVVKYMKKD